MEKRNYNTFASHAQIRKMNEWNYPHIQWSHWLIDLSRYITLMLKLLQNSESGSHFSAFMPNTQQILARISKPRTRNWFPLLFQCTGNFFAPINKIGVHWVKSVIWHNVYTPQGAISPSQPGGRLLPHPPCVLLGMVWSMEVENIQYNIEPYKRSETILFFNHSRQQWNVRWQFVKVT